ncbi:DUF5008 domain-containing protein [Chitinophaga sp. Cy-1792]|uniref:DUF5008 domain-containing protein n=1 Tax=Chitinophaga sp. Cy-1792 TaxID=2608339 RepID=UPI00141F11DE|nr:DUF5008 domain-containing protein [Chitinophaga sp. Cy-1792]NIG54181.1 DUF5008 domain-containing protein [Chitinophaga sp. Cy-1792]
MKQLFRYHIACFLLMTGVFAGCKKDNDKYYPDPYAGGKKPLGIAFSDVLPTPNTGPAGAQVVYKVVGLLAHKDSIHFYQNGELAQIVNVTDSTLTVVMPAAASSGTGWVAIGAQVFSSPLFRVSGKVRIDNTFKAGLGTDGPIYQITPTSDNRYLLTGSFHLYNSNGQGNWLNGIAKIEKNGQYVSDMKTDSAAGRFGTLYSAAELPGGGFILSGNFSTYGYKRNISNMVRVNSVGQIDTVVQTVIPEMGNYDPDSGGKDMTEANSKDTVSAFNGGSLFGGARIYYYNNRIYSIGSLYAYFQTYYPSSTRNAKVTDMRFVNSIMSTDVDGNLDSSYHYDLGQHQGLSGADGSIKDGIMQTDGKIVLVGKFTKFDNQPANNIVRLDNNGQVDKTFKSGTGTDGDIYSITFNPTTQKYLLSGRFTSYNGQPCNGVMLLNADGSPVPGFNTDIFGNGFPLHAGQLKNGMILVSGSFEKYGSRRKVGLVILNADGSYAAAYNNTGALGGVVYGIVETTSAEGETAVILYGVLMSFDSNPIGNICRIILAK